MLDELESERLESTRRVLSAQENERLRVARELHDEVGQTLTGVLLGLARVSRDAPLNLAQPLEQLLETTRASIDDVRRIAQRLRPEPLEDLGLAVALLALTRECASSPACESPAASPQTSPLNHLSVNCRLPRRPGGADQRRPSCQRRQHEHHSQLRSDHLALSVRDDGRGMPDSVARVAGCAACASVPARRRLLADHQRAPRRH